MIQVEKNEKLVVIKVAYDKLNSVVAPELKNTFIEAASENFRNMVLDLSETKYCDSTGLSAILVGNRICKNSNGTFVVTGIQDMVERLIKISQLDAILNIVPTVEEAKDYIYMEEIQKELDNE